MLDTVIRRSNRFALSSWTTSRFLRVLVLLIATLTVQGATAAPDRLVLGVHPYLSPIELRTRFQPLARYIEKHLQIPVSLRIGQDYREHVERIGKDQIDIAFVGPVSFLAITDRFGPKPLLARLQRNGRAVLDGHFVVREHSDIQSIGGLRGRRVGFGDPNSTMSSVVPMAVLKAHGILPDQLRDQKRYKGHTNIAFAVLSGQIDAGAVKTEVFERFRGRGLRSLHRLPEVSEHLFLARGDLEQAVVDRLKSLLLAAHESIEGLNALRALNSDATALVPVASEDYEPLRKLLRDERSGD